ncbi:uncharacterized protein LOC131168443 [Malania oleifera]|uniref:uncharacterized protein LOC131168443 n=1 Tax=Malania oleifera TaxID=397392 RepID=UPI0025ADFF10|nr:uncharacterized protein LOC131168443 [Malania oleifera]
MERGSLKVMCMLGVMVVVVGIIAGVERAEAAGECGKSDPNKEAVKLAPCAGAAQDENVIVPAKCCELARAISRNPSCLCAVMMSDVAKNSGMKPAIFITIPKRCNIADRPVGYKCGSYTLP